LAQALKSEHGSSAFSEIVIVEDGQELALPDEERAIFDKFLPIKEKKVYRKFILYFKKGGVVLNR